MSARHRSLRLVAVAAVVLAAAPGATRAQPGFMEKGALRVLLDRDSYAPGETARVAAVLAIDEGWHTNSHRPTFDYLIPTVAAVTPPQGWPDATEPSYPDGEMKTFAFADQPLSVYEGEVAILSRLAVPEGAEPGDHPIVVAVTYQACDDRSCLPPVTATAEASVPVGASGAARHPEVFDRGAGEASGAPRDRPARDGAGLAGILLLALVGGLILNAMPCVLPVLSLKVFALVQSSGHGRGATTRGGLATSLGILLSFWGLAAAAVLAKTAGGAVGWGVQFQEPAFVGFLTVVVLLFSLNLWGLFEIPLPGRLARIADSGPKEGVAGHLASGLFATLMATPCSAPFLGTAVGFALAQSAATIFAVFTAVGLGMALPYLALAVWPGAARLLPKPGAWMVTFKGVMGFLLAGAAVWLLYVLAGQVPADQLAFFELLLLVLALCVWLRGNASGRALRGAALAGAVVAALSGVVLLGRAPELAAGAAAAEDLIDWAPFDRAEAERRSAAGQPVFVDVTADWCFTCKVNERLVLETPEVAAAFEEHGVLAMKADWTNRSDTIADFLADHGRYGVPFYLLYRPGGEPHLFSELLTKDAVIGQLGGAAGR